MLNVRELETAQDKKAQVVAAFEAMQQWPYWNEVFLNCVKESPLSYAAFARAIQAGDSSQEAFEQALQNSRMTPAEFETFLPEYQKFMALQIAYANVGMVSDGVDQIWHGHMLVSSRYAQFCQEYLGFVLHHLPCSLYELYGVKVGDAASNCLGSCNPTTCKGNGGGGGCKRAPDTEENPQAIQQGILESSKNFINAYTETFGVAPDARIWNQLHGTRTFSIA